MLDAATPPTAPPAVIAAPPDPAGIPPVESSASAVAPAPASTPEPLTRAEFDSMAADLTAKHQQELATLRGEMAPQPQAATFESAASARASAKLGADVDPHVRQMWTQAELSIGGIEYKLTQANTPTERRKLMATLQHWQAQRSTAEGNAAVFAFQRQQAEQDQAQAPDASSANPDLSSLTMAALNEAAVMPVLTTSQPLLAAAIRGGKVAYADVLARVVDPTNNPAAQFISVAGFLEAELARTGTIPALAAPAAPAPNGSPSPGNPAAGMPAAGGAQASTQPVPRTAQQRLAADAAVVAAAQAAKN